MPVGNDGISFGIRGIPLENLEMPDGKDGISSGIHGIPLENRTLLLLYLGYDESVINQFISNKRAWTTYLTEEVTIALRKYLSHRTDNDGCGCMRLFNRESP